MKRSPANSPGDHASHTPPLLWVFRSSIVPLAVYQACPSSDQAMPPTSLPIIRMASEAASSSDIRTKLPCPVPGTPMVVNDMPRSINGAHA